MSDQSMGSDYDQTASSYSKMAIVIWCIVGWTYAALTWRFAWLPALLVFFPGIFLASFLAACFFIPLWRVRRTVNREMEEHGRERKGLILVGMALMLGGFLASIAGPIAYVRVLRHFMK